MSDNGLQTPFLTPMDTGDACPVSALETRHLFDLPLDTLIREARAVADRHPHQANGSPIILTGNCSTRPICRHCKWNHFKAIGRNPFILDITPEEAVARAHHLVSHGIQRAFCATGWLGYRLPSRFVHMVQTIHEAEPALALYGLFGALDLQSHYDLAEAGMTGMLTGLESPSEQVYRSFRPGGDTLDDRLNALGYARQAGLQIWTGFLTGLGEDADDCTRGIELLRPFEPESISILPFEPFPDTQMADHAPTDPAWLARVNAVARIALPLVPHFFTDHSNDFDHQYGQALGMNGSYETRI